MTSTEEDEVLIRNTIYDNNEAIFKAGFMKDASLFDENWERNWTPDAIIIRPSGNPMNRQVYKDLITNKSVSKVHFSNLLSIDSIRFLADGKAAVVTFTNHEKFEYNGTENDDIVKVSNRYI